MIEIIRVKNEAEMELVREIRMEVFVREQGVPVELELDELDNEAIHVIAYVDGIPAGCGRLVINGDRAKLGRVAVKKKMRRDGIGSGICKLLISIADESGAQMIYIGAQLTAVEFYKRLGFEEEGEVFVEAGIEHIKMVRK